MKNFKGLNLNLFIVISSITLSGCTSEPATQEEIKESIKKCPQLQKILLHHNNKATFFENRKIITQKDLKSYLQKCLAVKEITATDVIISDQLQAIREPYNTDPYK